MGLWMAKGESRCLTPRESVFVYPARTHPPGSAQHRATCARGSACEPAGWGTEERSILAGPLAPFVPPVRPAPRCPLALGPESFSEAPEGQGCP